MSRAYLSVFLVHPWRQVMETVRDLCSEGHTVVVAIHQPRSSIYALFDDILLLSEGRVSRSDDEKHGILSFVCFSCAAQYRE